MARAGLKVGIAALIVVALFVAGWVAATSGGGDGGGGASRAAVTRDEGDKDEGGGEAVQGSRVVWTGPLVDEAELTGDQMDAVFERVRVCMPVHRTPYLEMCLQGREEEWYEEDGSADEEVE